MSQSSLAEGRAADRLASSALAGSAGLVAVFVGWFVAFSPFWIALISKMNSVEHYSHWPLTLMMAGVMFYLKGKEGLPSLGQVRLRDRWYAVALLGVGILGFAVAVTYRSVWVGAVASLVGGWGLVELMGGSALRARLRAGWIVLWLLIPLPLQLDQQLVISLQKQATAMASRWLDIAGIANVPTGVVVRTAENEYLIEEACSGVNSLFSSLTVVLVWALLQRYGIMRSLLLLVAAGFWAAIVNAGRVFSIVWADTKRGIDLLAEPQHTVLGLVLFIAIFGLALATDRLLAFLLPPRERATDGGRVAAAESRAGLPMAAIIRFALPLFLLMAVTGGWRLYAGADGVVPGAGINLSLSAEESTDVVSLKEDLLPEKMGDFSRVQFESVQRSRTDLFGMRSTQWYYSGQEQSFAISVDGPFDDWHDLAYCYGAIEWKLREATNLSFASSETDATMVATSLELKRSSGDYALVFFTALDRNGNAIRPPAESGSFLRTLASRIGWKRSSLTERGMPIRLPIVQVQLYVESGGELKSEDRAVLQEIFDFARRRVAEQLKGAAELSGG